jgi:hypothetical protein
MKNRYGHRCFLARQAAKRLAVLFGLLPLMISLAGCTKTLTVRVAGVGSGGVSSVPAGISCGAGGAACTTTTKQGTSLTLNATASAGSVFAGWSGACSGSNPSCSVTLNNDATAFAYFRTTQVSTGAYHSCGLKLDGTVKCWGRNNEGQLGRGTTQNAGNDFPQTVTNLTNVVQVAAGGYHTCVLLVGGRCSAGEAILRDRRGTHPEPTRSAHPAPFERLPRYLASRSPREAVTPAN